MCELLKWHNKGSDSCIDTLNRLWRKHSDVVSMSAEERMALPFLSEDMLGVRAELWPLKHLLELKRSHTRDVPQFFSPIVVLRWFNQNFLLDGTTRVNFWAKHGNTGPHAVLVITERRGDI